MKKFILPLREVTMADVATMGGKNRENTRIFQADNRRENATLVLKALMKPENVSTH